MSDTLNELLVTASTEAIANNYEATHLIGLIDNQTDAMEVQLEQLHQSLRAVTAFENEDTELTDDIVLSLESFGFEDVREIAKQTVSQLKNAKAKAENVFKALGRILDAIATTLNAVAMTLGHLLTEIEVFATSVIKRAKNLQKLARDLDRVKEPVNVGKLKHLHIEGQRPTGKELIRGFENFNEICKVTISTRKLGYFNTITQDVLEPFRGSVKTTRVDQIIATIGLLGFITNPAIPASILLKHIASAVAPGIGKAVDIAAVGASAKVPTILLKGLKALIPAMGLAGAPMVREMIAGRLDLSIIPKYLDIYPYCKDEVKGNKTFLDYYRSPILLGNRYFEVSDYSKRFGADIKLSYKSTGARFKTLEVKDSKLNDSMEALSPNDIVVICDHIIDCFTYVKVYNKSFRSFYKLYNQLYREISELVMENTDESHVGMYVRYSYRNALNLMLDSMWKNCFGSDNKFIRHLVAVSRDTLSYCEQSLDHQSSEE